MKSQSTIDFETQKMVKICRALVRRFGGEVRLTKEELETEGPLLSRIEIDARSGQEDLFLATQ